MRFLICSLLLGSPVLVSQQAVTYAIFDLGGVLVETNKSAAFKEVGYSPFIQYALYNITHVHVLKKMLQEELLYPFLHSLEERSPLQGAARDPQGRLLPQIMCTHFMGKISDAHLRSQIEQALTAQSHLNLIEKNMLSALTSMMFTPERFIKTQYIIPEGKEFVRTCVTLGLKPCIHSTWARDSFELLKERDPEFFALFEDRIFVSGHTGMMKPDHASYTNITSTLGILPSTCIMFDDRPENISAARACGMHGFLIRPAYSWKHVPDFDTACAYLMQLQATCPGIA